MKRNSAPAGQKSVQRLSLFVIALCFVFSALPLSLHAQSGLDKGIELFKERKFSEAKKIFETSVKSNPENPSVHYYLGRISFNEQEYDKAKKSFEKAREIDNTKSEYHLWLGHTYGRKANSGNMMSRLSAAKKCKTSYQKAVETDPSNILARTNLMGFLLGAPSIAGGSKEEAKEQAEEIRKLDKLEGHKAFSRVYASEEKYDLQEKEIMAAIELDKEDFNLQYDLADFFQNTERYEEALELLKEIKSKSPDRLNEGRINAMGYNLVRAKKLDEAITVFIFNVESFPKSANVYDSLAEAYMTAGNNEKAIEFYKKAIEAIPNDPSGEEERLANLKKGARDKLKELEKK